MLTFKKESAVTRLWCRAYIADREWLVQMALSGLNPQVLNAPRDVRCTWPEFDILQAARREADVAYEAFHNPDLPAMDFEVARERLIQANKRLWEARTAHYAVDFKWAQDKVREESLAAAVDNAQRMAEGRVSLCPFFWSSLGAFFLYQCVFCPYRACENWVKGWVASHTTAVKRAESALGVLVLVGFLGALLLLVGLAVPWGKLVAVPVDVVQAVAEMPGEYAEHSRQKAEWAQQQEAAAQADKLRQQADTDAKLAWRRDHQAEWLAQEAARQAEETRQLAAAVADKAYWEQVRAALEAEESHKFWQWARGFTTLLGVVVVLCVGMVALSAVAMYAVPVAWDLLVNGVLSLVVLTLVACPWIDSSLSWVDAKIQWAFSLLQDVFKLFGARAQAAHRGVCPFIRFE